MNWTGKLIGGLLGYLMAGPFGSVFGIIIGHYFDIGANPIMSGDTRRTHQAQQAFFSATFLIMGYIAKADGRITEQEIEIAREVMRNMLLNRQMKREAISLFTQGKQANFNLDEAINNLLHYCGNQHNLLHMFLDIQFRAATAEGAIGPNKHKILEHLCGRLNFNIADFYVYEHAETHRAYGRGYHEKTGPRPAQPPSALDNAYLLLGVNKSAENTEVKHAYRKKMSENHPDKLVSKGLPEEMIKMATQKTQEIKAAYDHIRQARGI